MEWLSEEEDVLSVNIAGIRSNIPKLQLKATKLNGKNLDLTQHLSLQIKNMKNIYKSSEHERQIVYSAGHYFEIIDGVRHWLTPTPDDYICTNGLRINEVCRHWGITQEEWFSMKRVLSLGE